MFRCLGSGNRRADLDLLTDGVGVGRLVCLLGGLVRLQLRDSIRGRTGGGGGTRGGPLLGLV